MVCHVTYDDIRRITLWINYCGIIRMERKKTKKQYGMQVFRYDNMWVNGKN